ncbi:MAG: rane protein involved in the export of O-antigen and teichoic acid, partial [Armatimonadetes bacterium]|nr:rane protein involved in the export of O-antigen and teichoic acid [Armatimonadota bacterium]
MLPTGLLTAAFLTRALGPGGYGQYTLAASLVLWAEWSVAALFSRASIKLAGEADDWRPVGAAVLRLHLLMSLIVLAVFWIAAPSLAAALGEPALADNLRLFAWDVPLFCAAQAHQHLALSAGKFAYRSAASAIRWAARLLLILCFIRLGLGVPGAILGVIGSSAVELGVLRLRVKPAIWSSSGPAAREILLFARPLVVFALLLRLHDTLDLLLLEVISRSAREVGVYGAARNLCLVPSIAGMAVAPVLLATLTRLLKDHATTEARDLTGFALRAACGLLPIAGLVAGAAKPLALLLFGAEFVSSGTLIPPLIFGGVALVVVSIASAVLTAWGKPVVVIAIAVPVLAVSLAGYLALIAPWGALGAAVSSLAGSGLGAAIAVQAIH